MLEPKKGTENRNQKKEPKTLQKAIAVTKEEEKGGIPATTVEFVEPVEETPLIVEKPYIVSKSLMMIKDTASWFQNGFKIPKLEKNKVGTTPNFNNADEIPFDQVYVAKETDNRYC